MNKGHIVVCSPVLPEFDREAGSRRLFHHVQMLIESGWNVSYVTESPVRQDRYVRALEQIGCPVYLGFGPRVDALFSLGRVDVAVIAFWYLAEQQMERIRSLSPDTRIVIDSIDLHFLREARRLLANESTVATGSALNAQYADEFAREITAYAQADGVLTVSEKEACFINDLVGDPNRALHVGQAEALEPSATPLRDRRGLLFVGNFRHLPNVDAVEYLLGDIVPKIRDDTLCRHPLTIVGNGLTERIRAMADGQKHVRVVGWVPSLTPYYAQARLSLVPLRYGAGTKRKVIESLMRGVPVVSTSVGAEGLGLVDGRHVVIGDDPASFADAVMRLTADRRSWQRLSSAGVDMMAASHSWTTVKEQLQAVVEQVAGQAPRVAAWPMTARPRTAYENAVAELTRWLRDQLPGDAAVAVASKGDDDLLRLGGRRVAHLPSDGHGQYAGHHPASTDDLLRELDAWSARGGDHLVIPATASWWLEHYSNLSTVLARDWINLCAPTQLGHVFRHRLQNEEVDFECNLCGSGNRVSRAAIDRETPSCHSCGSTPRSRALIEALMERLFERSEVLSRITPRRDIRGVGLSDWDGYAQLLDSRFDYVNTFFRSDPFLDITTHRVDHGDLDFLVASEVFDHVVGEMEHVFENVRSMLKPGGVLVFTVPYVISGPTVEYDGVSDPATPTAGFTPARQFSLEGLLYLLDRAGFEDVKVHDDVNSAFGIWWAPRVSVPISASAR